MSQNIFLDISSTISIRDENMRYHCTDGPAKISLMAKSWVEHGTWHRLDGPAIIYNKNSLDYAFHRKGRFFIKDKEYSKENFYNELNLK